MNAPVDALLTRQDVWRGHRVQRAQPALASGHAELDALLPGGGWPLGALTEFCCAEVGLGELSLLLPSLAQLSAQTRWLAWVAPPYPLYAPALSEAGIDPARCLLVEPPLPGLRHAPARAQQALWAGEQLLRGGACGAVLLWWDGEDANALRRLQLAAEAGQSLAVLFRPGAAAQRLSPAALRVRIDAGPALEILKCRGGDWRAGRGQKLRLLARQPRGPQDSAGDATADGSAAAILQQPKVIVASLCPCGSCHGSDWGKSSMLQSPACRLPQGGSGAAASGKWCRSKVATPPPLHDDAERRAARLSAHLRGADARGDATDPQDPPTRPSDWRDHARRERQRRS